MNLRRALIVVILLVFGLSATAVVGESAETVQILAGDNFFNPADLTIQAGDTVVWKNTSSRNAHTVTSPDGSFDFVLQEGQELRKTFAKPGEVPYYCRFHGSQDGTGMAGTLVVEGTTTRVKDRIAGDDRFETAVALSQYQFPNGAEEVYLSASGVNPDALVGGALTAGPILLVPACGELPAVVKDEIDRLDPVKVVALGGVNTVCESILDQAVAR